MTEAIQLDLERELLYKLLLLAHQRGMTLNQLINHALRQYLETNNAAMAN